MKEKMLIKTQHIPENLSSLDDVTYITAPYISEIKNLPEGLIEFDCSHSRVTKLENLPKTLKKLNISYTTISKLENLPDGLEYLDCWHTRITSFKNLPKGIKRVYAYGTILDEGSNIDELLESLESLEMLELYEVTYVRNNENKFIKTYPQFEPPKYYGTFKIYV